MELSDLLIPRLILYSGVVALGAGLLLRRLWHVLIVLGVVLMLDLVRMQQGAGLTFLGFGLSAVTLFAPGVLVWRLAKNLPRSNGRPDFFSGGD